MMGGEVPEEIIFIKLIIKADDAPVNDTGDFEFLEVGMPGVTNWWYTHDAITRFHPTRLRDGHKS